MLQVGRVPMPCGLPYGLGILAAQCGLAAFRAITFVVHTFQTAHGEPEAIATKKSGTNLAA